jgi:hypothetical protein
MFFDDPGCTNNHGSEVIANWEFLHEERAWILPDEIPNDGHFMFAVFSKRVIPQVENGRSPVVLVPSKAL